MMDWSDDAIRQLRKLWDEGLSAAQIGLRLRTSKNSIVGKAHRIGLPPRVSPIVRKVEPGPSYTPRVRSRPTLQPLPSLQHPAPLPVPPEPDRIPRKLAPSPFLTCQWITTDNRPWLFCGATTTDGSAYCSEHDARCYVIMSRVSSSCEEDAAAWAPPFLR